MEKLPKNKKIVLFDGVCNLCDSTVQLLIKKDKNDIFRFVPLQSEMGKEILKYIGVDPQKIDSIVLYEPGIAYHVKSEAAIEIAKNIGGVYSLLNLFSVLPTRLNNLVYDFVAKSRYKWFGKKESCMMPTPEMKAKFLE
ncbi:thiol-disulfide oxidoreductase DCC family protein [Flavobacterium pedocola]